jgi:prephenate dehydrogenase
VAVVGLGLIGGSLARALTRAGWRVIGCDRWTVLRKAWSARVLAEGCPVPEEAAARADLVVLAAPPRVNLALLRRVARAAATSAVVTDVSSVKRPILRAAARLGLRSFVGGHPMAGSEGSGFDASSPDLFSGRPWILTPARASPRAVARVRALVRAVGARPVSLGAAEHDRVAAFLSHLPQLVAWALIAAARGDATARRHAALAGPAFHDMTRLAASPRPLWREILRQNQADVARALLAFHRALRRARP